MLASRTAWSSFRAHHGSPFRSVFSNRLCSSCLRSYSTSASRAAPVRLIPGQQKHRWIYLQLCLGGLFVGFLVHRTTFGQPISNDSPPIQPVSLAQVDEYTKSMEKITRNSPMRLRMEAL